MKTTLFVVLSLLALGHALAAEEGETVAVAAGVAVADQNLAVADAAANAGANSEAQTATAAESESEVDAEAELAADAAAETEVDAEGVKKRPINCMDAKVRGVQNKDGNTGSGVYWVKPLDGLPGFHIFCDMETDGGGWNVIMKRHDGSTDFYRPWVDYKKGFGSKKVEHWLGLDKIHRMSKTMPHKLRVELQSFDGVRKYGTWRTFMVDDEEHKYTLTARGFRDGGIGNSLRYHSGRPFSTYDRDNDAWANNCASYFHGAWWYGACHNSNLAGKYYPAPGKHPQNYADGADWLTYKGHFESNKRVVMKFK